MRKTETPPEYADSLHPLVVDALLPAAASSGILAAVAFLVLAFL